MISLLTSAFSPLGCVLEIGEELQCPSSQIDQRLPTAGKKFEYYTSQSKQNVTLNLMICAGKPELLAIVGHNATRVEAQSLEITGLASQVTSGTVPSITQTPATYSASHSPS